MEQPNRPVHSFRYGNVSAAIWKSPEGFMRTTLVRVYKDGDTWGESGSFDDRDLPHVMKAAADAQECLNRVIVLNEAHLKRTFNSYFKYYHDSRPHLSLDRDSPMPRRVEPPAEGQVVAIPQVVDLHHRYTRRAA